MSIFLWEGPEQMIGGMPCAITFFTVESMARVEREVEARGSIIIMDYMENCDGEHSWHAITRTDPEDKHTWVVKCEEKDGFCFRDEKGEALFTLCSPINAGMKEFIAEELDGLLLFGYPRDRMPGIVSGYHEYAGPRVKYEGPCVCRTIRDTALREGRTFFDWKKHTHGGKYPSNCFECSCGAKWWCAEPGEEIWFPVGDQEAWEMLTRANGEAVQLMGFHGGAFHLLRSLRNKGMIPLPASF